MVVVLAGSSSVVAETEKKVLERMIMADATPNAPRKSAAGFDITFKC